MIIQISTTNGEVYGLTDDGILVRYDANIGKFVVRCDGEIYGIKAAANINKPEPRIAELGRHRSTEIRPKKVEKKMITPFLVAVGILGFAILVYFFR